MKKASLTLFVLFISLFSTLFADGFQQNKELIETFKANNIRIILLCNFQGTNNILDIVTSSRSPGYELTNSGLATLQDTSVALESQNITRIYTAPAYRAQQTTNYLGKAFQLTPNQLVIDTRLGMQNFGSSEGEDYDVYKLHFTSEKNMFEGTPPNGEAGIAVFNRSQSLLLSLADFENQTILIVTHAFNFCHLSKCLSGKYGNIPSPGTFIVYDFN